MSVLTKVETRDARGIRTLHFGSDWVQGAMRISRPWDLELLYTREMMAALLLSAAWPAMPQRILQIGLGAGSFTRFIFRHLPEAYQVVVERAPVVVGAANQNFKLPPEGERLRIDVADGVDWMASSSETFDLILVDGFDADGQAGGLERVRFYQDARQRLKPGGLFVCNLLSRSPGFLESCLALDSAFSGRTRLLPQTPGGNVIALASTADTLKLDEPTLRTRATVLLRNTGLDLLPLVARLVGQADGLPLGIWAEQT